jgi:uncharacterized protein YcfJ
MRWAPATMSRDVRCGTRSARSPALVAGLAACLAACLGVAAAAAEVFYDYATVVDVEPVMESKLTPVPTTLCTEAISKAPAATLEPGDVRALSPGLSIGESIRLERAARAGPTEECRDVTRYEPRREVKAYRVTYRYGDETFVRRMRRDPGDRVQVRVELDPMGRAQGGDWQRP